MVSQPCPAAYPALCRSVTAILLLGALSLDCAHTVALAGEVPKSTAEGVPQAPPNEVKTVDVTIREERIEAAATVYAGGLTFSFFNASGRPSTASIEGRGGPWRIERSIPHDRSMTLEVTLEPGDYVLVCQPEGKAKLTAAVRAVKPIATPPQTGMRKR